MIHFICVQTYLFSDEKLKYHARPAGKLSNKSSENGVPKSVRHNVRVVDFAMPPAVDAGFFVASGLA